MSKQPMAGSHSEEADETEKDMPSSHAENSQSVQRDGIAAPDEALPKGTANEDKQDAGQSKAMPSNPFDNENSRVLFNAINKLQSWCSSEDLSIPQVSCPPSPHHLL